MKLCPCGRYRQLNSFLYPNNHYTEIVKNNIKLVSLKRFLVLAGIFKVGNFLIFLQNSTQIPSLEALVILYAC